MFANFVISMIKQIAIITVSFYLIVANCAPGVFLCWGNNGHVALEFSNREVAYGTHHAKSKTATLLNSHAEDCGDFCIDIPLGSDSQQDILHSQPNSAKIVSSAVIPSVSFLSRGFNQAKDTYYSPYNSCDLLHNLQIFICRTVCLLI